MLSKKMTVSLMSLITILTFAFVVTPAMAGFGVSLDKTGDISTQTDGLDLEHPDTVNGGEITLTVEFAKAVILGKKIAQIITLDKDGMLLSLQEFPPKAETAADVGTTKSIGPVKIGKNAKTVKLLIAADAATAASPFDTEKSNKLEETINLIGADDGAPTVYSIKRAVDDTHTFAKISPKTDPVVEVRVVLSELPKKFDKAHINVTDNATVTSVRQLLPEEGRTLATYLASDDVPDDLTLTRIRKIYDETFQETDAAGIVASNRLVPVANNNTAPQRKKQLELRAKYGGIHRAINEAEILDGKAYTYKFLLALADDAVDLDPKAADTKFGVADDDADDTAEELGTDDRYNAGYLLLNYKDDQTADALGAPGKPGDAVTKPPVPKVSDYGDQSLYNIAKNQYIADYNKYRVYANAKALHEAYTAAVKAEEMKDTDARLKEFEDSNISRADRVATGVNEYLYPYLVVLTPKYANTNDIVVKVKAFEDRHLPTANKYMPPSLESGYTEGVDKLTIQVAEAKVGAARGAGIKVAIPNETRIPASGFTVFATNNVGSGIKDNPGNDKDEPKETERTPAQLKYNLVQLADLPNLETFLLNGGTIALEAPAGVYISEIMWGSDASLSPNNNSQWIEIANTGSTSILTGDGTHKLWFYGPNETPISTGVADTVGTVGAGGYWAITGMGQSGRTGTGEQAADVVATVPTQKLYSMQRLMMADGTPADGTMKSGWAQSVEPALNFDASQVGARVGTPGAAPVAYPTAPTPTPTPTPTPATPIAAADDIDITEIMVDTANGRLPQWIELTSSATGEVSLDGWEMVIDNAIDADVLGGGNAITVSLGGVTLDVSAHTGNTGKGQSVLVVAWAAGRKSANISDDRVLNLATQLKQTSRYQLLSYKGFRITLVPPEQGAIAKWGDIAGNLDEDWELPMAEGTRSSLIRREMDAANMATMGTDANGWILASSSALITGQQSYYGSDEDAGTPGQDAGGPLPVELSMFYPARDKVTGAVVIKWETQSELNNAGFFIKRSQQRTGQFKVINATMIAGAGTTSEKQTYTYTDTTAQPNVVYYYQIEDVSLDGQRQQLTRGIRLRGHIGAAGKATTLWGELKSSNE